MKTPAPSPLSKAIQNVTGSKGFTLVEVALVVGSLALLSSAGFVVYRSASNASDVRTEQTNIRAIAANADRVYGSGGSYVGVTTAKAIGDRVPPSSMVSNGALLSRFSQPVMLEPTDIGSKPNAGLRITYEAVPARACAALAQAASGGMYEVTVGGASIFRHDATGRPLDLDTSAAVARCANGGTMVFIYASGATGLAGDVLPPVNLPPVAPPTVLPPAAPPPAPAPTASPWTPPATPPATPPSLTPVPSAPPAPVTPPVVAPPSAPPATLPATPPSVTPRYCEPGSVPAPKNESESQTGSCPAGQLTSGGSGSFSQTRNRTTTYACVDPYSPIVATQGSWSAWSPVASSVCAPACSAPASSSSGLSRNETQTQTLACPAGQSGAGIAQQRTRTESGTRTTSWTCPSPTGSATSSTSDSWSGSYTYSAWTTTSNNCAPVAPPPPPPPVSCSASQRTDVPGAVTGTAPEYRACNASNLGQRAVKYQRLYTAGPHVASWAWNSGAICTSSGWATEEGHSPRQDFANGVLAGLEQQGSQDYGTLTGRDPATAQYMAFTTYQCPFTP